MLKQLAGNPASSGERSRKKMPPLPTPLPSVATWPSARCHLLSEPYHDPNLGLSRFAGPRGPCTTTWFNEDSMAT